MRGGNPAKINAGVQRQSLYIHRKQVGAFGVKPVLNNVAQLPAADVENCNIYGGGLGKRKLHLCGYVALYWDSMKPG